MDILTHTLSGLAIGTVVSSFSKKGYAYKCGIVFSAGLAGALPDIDAISLWSKFDATIGRFFNLPMSGREIYSAKLWYSHHACMHSMVASLLLSIVAGLSSYLIHAQCKGIAFRGLVNFFSANILLFISFNLGFIMHLLGDMPTPASSWGGVNFLWPMGVYLGGTGDIWWWNNYDIFLIVASVLLCNLCIALIRRKILFNVRIVTAVIFMLGFLFACIHIKTRECDFSYSGHTNRFAEYEDTSKALQRDILGEALFHIMEEFDNKLQIHF